jgi:hypothetical protein
MQNYLFEKAVPMKIFSLGLPFALPEGLVIASVSEM